jgi:hypothetical protein
VRISDIDLYRQIQVIELRAPLAVLISKWAAARATSDERATLLAMAKAFESPAGKRNPVTYLRHLQIGAHLGQRLRRAEQHGHVGVMATGVCYGCSAALSPWPRLTRKLDRQRPSGKKA